MCCRIAEGALLHLPHCSICKVLQGVKRATSACVPRGPHFLLASAVSLFLIYFLFSSNSELGTVQCLSTEGLLSCGLFVVLENKS